MSLHYRKDGGLDMRYSSSRAAVSSGYGGSSSSSSGYGGGTISSGSSSAAGSSGGYGGSSWSSSGYGGGTISSGSSSTAGSSGGYGGTYSSSSNSAVQLSSTATRSGTTNELHYKKDGSLDMRYSTSKAASTESSLAVSGTPTGSSSSQSAACGDLHLKKDGTPDMRYKSSKQAADSSLDSGIGKIQLSSTSETVHTKKDGSLDMRYKSSKQAASRPVPAGQPQNKYGIPAKVPTKADGTPDMRKKDAKEWVKKQAGTPRSSIPDWVPKKKDGTIDTSKAIGRVYVENGGAVTPRSEGNPRRDYYIKRILDPLFLRELVVERQEPQCIPPLPPVLHEIQIQQSPKNVLEIDYSSLEFEKDSTGTLGRGSFGVVLKATWNGKKAAVKKLHLTQLTRKEKADFEKEICILAALGEHPNLVKLYGYCSDPPCIVMELVELGSLSHLLHYCEDTKVEVKMTDGRIKKRLVYGIASGMVQLHAARIVHGDLKPQNVLVTHGYTSKVTDFGLSTLRGKTSSSIRTTDVTEGSDSESSGAAGGTAGYMAPELLDSTSPPDFTVDVYSFGILLNEVVSEEEPFSDQYQNFAGRGPFGAANYAKQGKRPTVNGQLTPPSVEALIVRCWSPTAAERPTFKQIIEEIEPDTFLILDSVSPKL